MIASVQKAFLEESLRALGERAKRVEKTVASLFLKPHRTSGEESRPRMAEVRLEAIVESNVEAKRKTEHISPPDRIDEFHLELEVGEPFERKLSHFDLIRNDNDDENFIGSGCFGKVRAAVHRLTGLEVAIKTVKKKPEDDVPMECILWQKVDHPNFCRLFQVIVEVRRLFLCFFIFNLVF